MVLVDSSIWIDALRRDGDLTSKLALEGLLEAGEAAWCGPIKLEVMGGVAPADRKKLAFFFQAVTFLDLPPSIWSESTQASWKMRDKGIVVPWNDLVVATLAGMAGCRVYARDRHFEQMAKPLRLRLYQPGYGGTFQPG
jgi:predicted nucleic acid-binding protein